MMKLKKISMVTISIIIILLLTSSIDKELFQLNKTFDIFGAVYKQLNEKYVNEIETEKLMKNGIEGMLKGLDPYTEYYEEDDTESIDLITKGNYVGFGITISHIEKKVTIVNISSNSRALMDGLRIGDILYKIDTVIVENMTNSELKQYTQGKQGSKVKVKVLRGFNYDTLSLVLERNKIKVENVSYSGVIKDSIGYIKLNRFSKYAFSDFKKALLSLQKKKINGLIIDLRNNPGGLLREAVRISELFLPKGSLIVSTKGKNERTLAIYKSRIKPIAPEIPIAVLINSGSASASEIVAGALQDNDRALILGNESFGKGLVQTVVDLPYNSNLKITTAKYYTPSGRCIQKIDYSEKEVKNQEDKNQEEKNQEIKTKGFFTNSGRKLYSEHGITPDSVIANVKKHKIIKELISTRAFFSYSNHYTKKLNYLSRDWSMPDSVFDSFILFSQEENLFDDISDIVKLEKIKDDKIHQSENISELLNKLLAEFNKETIEILNEEKVEVNEILRTNILKRFHYTTDIEYQNLENDNVVSEAIDLISSEQYSRILTNEENNQKVNKKY